MTGVRLDGAEIARTGREASGTAHWSIDAASGDVLIEIPPRPKRDVTVEFTNPGVPDVPRSQRVQDVGPASAQIPPSTER